MTRWLECQSEEWMRIKFFAYLHHVDSGWSYPGLPVTWEQLKLPTAQSVVLLILGIAGNLLSHTLLEKWIFAALTVFSLPFFIIRIAQVARERHRELEQQTSLPVPGTCVPYLLIRNDGIQVHVYHPLDEQTAPFVSWESMKAIRLRTLVPPYVLGARMKREWFPGEVERYVEQIRHDYPSVEIKPQSEYPDHLSVVVTHHDGYQSQLPIPTEWLDDGRLTSFLHTLERVSGMPVTVEPSASGIFR